MRTITTDKLNTTYLKNIRRYNYIITIAVLVFILICLLWMVFHSGDPSLSSEAPWFLLGGILLGASLILYAVQRARTGPISVDVRYRSAWFLIFLGLLIHCCCVVYIINWPRTLSFPYVFLVCCSYILTLLGFLRMPGAVRLHISLLLDALIATLCLICLFWLVLSTAMPASSDLLLDAGSLLMPGSDIFLLLVLALIARQAYDATMRLPFYCIGASFLCTLWGHLAVTWLFITGQSYHPGHFYIDWFWLVGTLFLGLAALFQYTILVQRASADQTKLQLPSQPQTPADGIVLNRGIYNSWRVLQSFYIPIALLISLLIIVFSISSQHGKETSASSMTLTALVGALIIIRYFLASRENEHLLKDRELRYNEAERVRHFVSQLSDIRDLELLRERIINTMLTEFGFTFAMLLLIEEYEGSFNNQAHLLVNTNSISSHPTKWRLSGDTILSRTVLAGKRTELNWFYHLQDTPVEVRNWLERQHVPPMVFFPIVYREKILGSLGVARHALARRTQSEVAIIRQYTEQMAAIIEHAYLYREAREREAFARAMANISTRLNAVAVEPAEISQLICEEGANALHADYVVLYIVEEDQQLQPLAASVGEDQSASMPQHWPGFTLSEYEDETSKARHPVLFDITQRRRSQLTTSVAASNNASTTGTADNNREYFGPRLFSLRAKLARHFIQTVILAPLVAGGQMIGLVLFARSTPPGTNSEFSFDTSDLPHAQDFVEQAGVAFANARLYSSLRATHERLKELDQLKDQFMITASHELRTPLTAVQGYIELMAQYDEILPLEQRREFLQKAQLGCEELAVLLRNVMDASRLEAEAGIKPALISRVRVIDIVEKVNVMIEPQVTHEQRAVALNVPGHLCVYADPVRLHQVLMNIAFNALKYSPASTPIAISASLKTEQSNTVIISIADKGKGIKAQDQGQLFQRFVRLEDDLNSPVRGSGLGLYISRRLVEAMGGKIWIESKGIPGEGSTFHVQLPMA